MFKEFMSESVVKLKEAKQNVSDEFVRVVLSSLW